MHLQCINTDGKVVVAAAVVDLVVADSAVADSAVDSAAQDLVADTPVDSTGRSKEQTDSGYDSALCIQRKRKSKLRKRNPSHN